MSCDLNIWILLLKHLNNEPITEQNIINIKVATQFAIKQPIWFYIINNNSNNAKHPRRIKFLFTN